MFFIFLTFEGDDKSKFEYVYEKWKKLMYVKAFGVLNDRALAQDAVSEAFIRAYKNIRKLDDPDSGRTAAFLIMIVKNAAIDILNKRSRTVVTDMADWDEADSFDLEGAVVSENTRRMLMKEVDKLKDDLKTAFLLRYAYDYSMREIGEALKISENNAAVRVHRAKSKLAKVIRANAGL